MIQCHLFVSVSQLRAREEEALQYGKHIERAKDMGEYI